MGKIYDTPEACRYRLHNQDPLTFQFLSHAGERKVGEKEKAAVSHAPLSHETHRTLELN
jgi:hypothetical protein